MEFKKNLKLNNKSLVDSLDTAVKSAESQLEIAKVSLGNADPFT